jgi:hypothetical protein
MPMELLTFAHRGEAKAFLKNDQFSPVPFLFDGLYKNEHRFLLIHGEGLQTTSEKLAVVCGAFREKIHAVINLGVCGSLRENSFKMGEIFPIRTCYSEGEFKSFSTPSKTGVDIISSKERVKDLNYAKNLSFFAPLVDREAWAVGSVCHLLNLPFYSFKLISDYSDNEDICQLVSSKSEEISESLYNYFLQVKIENSNLIEKEKNNLWATTSQRRLYNSLSKKMELKGIKYDPSSLDSGNLAPKKRMSKILEDMEKNLFPFESGLKDKLEKHTQSLKDSKIDVKFSKDFEDSSVLLSFKIQNQKELEKIVSSLSSFPYQNIKDLLDGRIDV